MIGILFGIVLRRALGISVPPSNNGFFLMEDGTSYFLMEDGVSKFQME
jgi:hypothetical protein